MRRALLFWLLATVLLITADTAGAQQAKIPRVGYLSANTPSTNSARIEAFRQGLRELGYLEGKNIFIESRWAAGKQDSLPGLAAELVSLKVDIIVSGGSTATQAAKDATSTIPIVMSQDNDPVENKFVASLARPGGNITGLATLRSEVSGKRMEILKEIIPKLSRIAVLGTSNNPGNAQALKEIELAAGALNVRLQILDVLLPKNIEVAFRTAWDPLESTCRHASLSIL